MNERPQVRCNRCKRTPAEIDEYVVAGRNSGMSPDAYVWAEEGTLNTENGHFLCTTCYIAEGEPTAPPPGWKAP